MEFSNVPTPLPVLAIVAIHHLTTNIIRIIRYEFRRTTKKDDEKSTRS